LLVKTNFRRTPERAAPNFEFAVSVKQYFAMPMHLRALIFRLNRIGAEPKEEDLNEKTASYTKKLGGYS